MESTPDQAAEGMAVVRVLSAVLERLVSANSRIARTDPGQVTKFHALKAPGIGITQYLERIHKYASCSNECFILALIYIDRLIQRNNFLLTELNVHRVVITAVLLAAKFFDDAYYNNAYYAKVGGVLVSEMNGLEVEFLFRINFSLHASPELFQKYRDELVAHALGTGLGQHDVGDTLQHPQLTHALNPISPQIHPMVGGEPSLAHEVHVYQNSVPVQSGAVHEVLANNVGMAELSNTFHQQPCIPHITPSPPPPPYQLATRTTSKSFGPPNVMGPAAAQVTSTIAIPVPAYGVPAPPVNTIIHHHHLAPNPDQLGPISSVSQNAIHVPGDPLLNAGLWKSAPSSRMVTPSSSISSNLGHTIDRRNSHPMLKAPLTLSSTSTLLSPNLPNYEPIIAENGVYHGGQYVAHYHHLNDSQPHRDGAEISSGIQNYGQVSHNYQPSVSHLVASGCRMERTDSNVVAYDAELPPQPTMIPFGPPQFVETTSPLLVPGAGHGIAGSLR